MAEALAALGLASSIVQFIDFGLKITSTIKEIHSSASGLTSETTTLNDITTEFEKIVSSLQKSAYDNGPRLSREDIELKTLATKTILSARKIEDIIDPLRKQSAKPRLRDAVKTGFKSWRSKEKLETVTKELQSYKSVLDTRLLVDVRIDRKRLMSMNIDHSQQLEDLDDTSRSLYNTLKASRNENASYFVQIMEAIRRLHLQSSRIKSTERRRVEVLRLQTVGSYTARPNLSDELVAKLHTAHPKRNPPYSLAITGLGGCGKTQLTLDYIERYKSMYNGIFWIDGSSAANALNSFREIADTLQLPRSNETVHEAIWNGDVVRNVLRWLKEAPFGRWLVIIDSADDSEWGIRNLIPAGTEGTVIITSQLKDANALFTKGSEILDVYTMNDEEAKTLLLQDIETPTLAIEERQASQEIVEILGNLPLAIDLARAVIANSRYREWAVQGYLGDLKDRKDKIFKRTELKGIMQYQKTLVDVWDISISAVQAHSPSAANLLKFLSFLDPHAIQDEMWRLASHGLQELRKDDDCSLPHWLEALLRHDGLWCNSLYEDDLRWLQTYSLVRPLTGEWPGVSMHGLVQWRGQAEISRDEYKIWTTWVLLFQAAISLKLLEELFEFRRCMVVHLRSLQQLLFTSTMKEYNWIFGRLYADEGWWEEAETLQVDVMEKTTAKLGPDHPDTLTSMANLASTYQNQGRWEEAETLEVDVIEKTTAKLGPDHPDTLRSMANLANTYQNQGQWNKAETLKVDVIEKMTAKLGPDHPNTLTSIANLAVIYQDQGQWDEAETLQVDVIEKRTAKLGPNHPNTLTSIANLAGTYRNQGRWEEAETLEVDVMEKTTAKLGPDHPDTLRSIANLASTYQNQGRWNEAETLQVDVIEKRTAKLGPNHPDTLRSMANLAGTYWNQGQWEEAETLEVDVMEKTTVKLGPDHPDTLRSMANLANTYQNQGRWNEAETLQVDVMEKTTAKLRPGHPDTLRNIANLAITYQNQGQWNEAETLQVDVIEKRTAKLGPGHPDTLRSMANLAITYQNQGRWEEVETLEVDVIEKTTAKLGPDHPDTLRSMANLAVTYQNQGRWDEAEKPDQYRSA
ncbi:MAG: hypothetical protein Q9162_002354 [Coniocarpon cinnabarinum]